MLYVCSVCGYYWTQEGKTGPSYSVGRKEPAPPEPNWCPHPGRHPDRRTAEVEPIEVIPLSAVQALAEELEEQAYACDAAAQRYEAAAGTSDLWNAGAGAAYRHAASLVRDLTNPNKEDRPDAG